MHQPSKVDSEASAAREIVDGFADSLIEDIAHLVFKQQLQLQDRIDTSLAEQHPIHVTKSCESACSDDCRDHRNTRLYYPWYSLCVLFCHSIYLSKEQKEICSYANQVAVTVNSQPGQSPASDAAVTLARVAGGNLIPKVVYECKPTVHPHLEFVSDHE